MNKTHVGLCLDDAYVDGAEVAVRSMAEHLCGKHVETPLAIGSCLLSAASRRRLSAAAGDREVLWLSYGASTLPTSGYSGTQLHVSDTTYLRVFMPADLTGVASRLVYVDSDVVVQACLACLGDTPLRGHTVAAVQSAYVQERDALLDAIIGARSATSARGRYFNAGLLVVDIDAWQQGDVERQVRSIAERVGERLEFREQDALNWLLGDSWLELPRWWNLELHTDRHRKPQSKLDEYVRLGKVLHYVGPVKPWLPEFPEGVLKEAYQRFQCQGHQ